ncbi:hypothetical protein ABIA33_005002 [Streptacidiphilus sp. MAP12-16]
MSGGGRATVGIALADARGGSARPITLEATDHIRDEAVIPFAGRRRLRALPPLGVPSGRL